MTDRVLRGHWWLPEDEENPQPGILTISDQGELVLDLIGGFDLEVRLPSGNGFDLMGADRRVPVLLGHAGQTDVTLLDCYTKQSRGINLFGGHRPTFHRLGAGRALVGIHLQDSSDAVFERAEVRLEDLFNFLSQESLRHTIDTKGGRHTAAVEEPPALTVVVNGIELTAGQRVGQFDFEQSRDSSSVVARAHATLIIKPPQPLAHDGFETLIKSFMDLLTLASGQPCGIIRCILVHQTPRITRHGDRVIERPVEIELFNQRIYTAQPDQPAQEHRKWLFTCAERGYEDLVSSWVSLHEKALAACSVLFGMKYTDVGVLETQALMTAVSAEAMHKSLYGDVVEPPHPEAQQEAAAHLQATSNPKTIKEIKRNLVRRSYRNRLLYLATVPPKAAVDMIIPSALTWANEMVDVRNGLAHEAHHPGNLLEVYELTMSTTYLLYLILMTRLGFDEAQQVSLVQRQGWK